MVTTDTGTLELSSVLDAFAAYVTAMVRGDETVDDHHAAAHKLAHRYRQQLVRAGEAPAEGYMHHFLVFVAGIFNELAAQNPENRSWFNFCRLRAETMLSASMIASPSSKTRRRKPEPDEQDIEPVTAAEAEAPETAPLLSVTLAAERQATAASARPNALTDIQLAQRRAAGRSRSRHPRMRPPRRPRVPVA